MSVEITRTRETWDTGSRVRTKVRATKIEEAIAALRLVEEYDATVIAGAEFAEIVDKARRE